MYALKNAEDVMAKFDTSVLGISYVEAEKRIQKHGFNELPEKKKSLFLLFIKQFNSILVYILFAALVFSTVIPIFESHGELSASDFLDSFTIAAILIVNALLGFFQEKKAENAISSLRKLSEPMAKVKRNGNVKSIPSREIVPGDILLLEEGDRVSADGRIISEMNSSVDEAALTGESVSVEKISQGLENVESIGDQINMVFKGTVLTAGRMEVCVTGTALNTELGKVAQLVADTEHPPTPLEKSMSALGVLLGWVVLGFCALIFLLGVIRGMSIGEMLLAAASLAVSAVPEGLPAVVTVCLAIGVQRMIGKKVLTRELQAIETLGSVTIICTDKTGTITENEMEVRETWSLEDDDEDNELLLRIGSSCNNAHSLEVGDPTEIGLLKAAMEGGIERLEIINEDVPFNSDRKYMVTTHLFDGEYVKYIKGAPEVIVSMCDLDDDEKEKILKENEEMAGNALRVLACAYSDPDSDDINDADFVGLVGMMDPPRDGVKEAVEIASKAGVRTVMITGDHALTAKSIGKYVGIESEVVIGSELKDMSDEELKKCVHEKSIYARVSPSQKVRILSALQETGEIVAMGGDGVNDAPALKRAHVGFAMGKRGTDVARETAEMVLTNDHYSSVVSAIEEGRTIYDNIRKFVVYLLRANFDELAVIFGAILVGLPLPYLPIHILMVNLVTDSLPAMALALEKPEKDIMKRSPRTPGEHILHGEIGFIVLAAFVATCATFHVFLTGLHMPGGGIDIARSMAVTTSMLFELTLVFTCRSRRSLLSIGPFSNPYLIGAVGIAFAIMLTIMYTPIAPMFYMIPLSLSQWMLPVVWSAGALAFFEIAKVLKRG
ncbi:cation-translocating P-type ATPase [Candidatus Peribacteria bacterium]|jgi:P-type Ca2+ transporter type 2C|nr:cation-translocating P-type ATPase [Candidatus Peribacteria bacterium]MBT4021664.1 cation-translocating P-type ATPase [Candidatus Peribacteria bacterium]MBT4240828.1 cation-translocating P-type ATPase [Candidatus Peribacteria bacterium]MBT4474143.1 cation-translocating P-type ATPase [Candidatus Peribacteria bacterium]